MKDIFKKRYLILVMIAFILGLGITRTASHWPVSPCMDEPSCIAASNSGTLQTKTQGYPLALQQKKTFKPNDTSKYAETSLEVQSFSLTSAIINAVFWFALLDLTWRAGSRLLYKSTTKK